MNRSILSITISTVDAIPKRKLLIGNDKNIFPIFPYVICIGRLKRSNAEGLISNSSQFTYPDHN